MGKTIRKILVKNEKGPHILYLCHMTQI